MALEVRKDGEQKEIELDYSEARRFINNASKELDINLKEALHIPGDSRITYEVKSFFSDENNPYIDITSHTNKYEANIKLSKQIRLFADGDTLIRQGCKIRDQKKEAASCGEHIAAFNDEAIPDASLMRSARLFYAYGGVLPKPSLGIFPTDVSELSRAAGYASQKDVHHSHFTAEGLIYAAQKLKRLPLLKQSDRRVHRNGTYLSRLLSEITFGNKLSPAIIPWAANNHWEIGYSYNSDRSKLARSGNMSRFFAENPARIFEGYEYLEHVKDFYPTALQLPLSALSFYNPNARRVRDPNNHYPDSGRCTHVGLNLGKYKRNIFIKDCGSIAYRIRKKYSIPESKSYLLSLLEVSVDGKKLKYNVKEDQFEYADEKLNPNYRLSCQWDNGKHVQVADAHIALQAKLTLNGRRQNFEGVIPLSTLVAQGFYPSTLWPLGESVIRPKFRALLDDKQREKLVPVSYQFRVTQGSTLDSHLRAWNFNGFKRNLLLLYYADKLGINPYSGLYTPEHIFDKPDLDKYQAEIKERGGYYKVSCLVAKRLYPDASFVVNTNHDPYDMLDALFPDSFLNTRHLSMEAQQALIKKIFKLNKYRLGSQWPIQAPAHWERGQIFGLTGEQLRQLKQEAQFQQSRHRTLLDLYPQAAIKVAVKKETKTIPDKLIEAARLTTESTKWQSLLLGLYLNESGQGSTWSTAETIANALPMVQDQVSSVGDLQVNIDLYAKSRGMEREAAKNELIENPRECFRFTMKLLHRYQQDAHRQARLFTRVTQAPVDPSSLLFATLDAHNAGSIYRAQFMGFQYMLYLLARHYGVLFEYYQVDGYKGQIMKKQLRTLFKEVDPTNKLVEKYQWKINAFDRFDEKTLLSFKEDSLYMRIIELFSSTFGEPPLLFLNESQLRESFVKKNYALNAHRYAQDIKEQLDQ
jgi:hypothetical protein